MPRYVAVRPKRPPLKGWCDFGEDHPTAVQPLGQPTVYDAGPVTTGLLDKDGNEIIRVPDQIGFVQHEILKN